MARVRIYQLAKEIDISSKEMMDILLEIGMDVKSPSSTIEESIAETVKQIIAERRPQEPEPELAAAPEPESKLETKPPAEVSEPKLEVERTVSVDREAVGEALPSVEPIPLGPTEAPPAPPVAEGKRRTTRKERKDEILREGRRAAPERAVELVTAAPKVEEEPAPVSLEHRTIKIPSTITVRELAERSGISSNQLLAKLLSAKILRSVNQTIASDVASQVLEEFNISVEVDRRRVRVEELTEEEREDLVPVAPVVTIMGHVDHGKTTLLDRIRNTDVAGTEAGQITQRIGAYEAVVKGKKIVFLDTPGHEAFTMMRARGAHVTDVAVLVVAADDGVMPQTLEAIDHARAANVPIIIAVNKIDKPEANQDHVKHQLSEIGLAPEAWGGETIFMPVSAKQGIGIEDLLEMILLVAEMEDLRANPKGRARGVVIESRLDPQRGPTATVLVQQGTLRAGDYIVAGSSSGRVRAMFNYKGEELQKAGPATPVSIIGFDASPHASDVFKVAADGKIARMKASEFARESRSGGLAGIHRITLDDLFAQIQKGEVKDLNIIVKADVHGSVEALCQSLVRLEHEEVKVKIIHRGVGNISESDIMLASASNAIILGFAVSVDLQAQAVAERENIDVRTYDVIYDVINDVKAAMLGMLEPVYEEKLLGEAEVRAIFKSSRTGVIAGCMVTHGILRRNTKVKILRDRQGIHEGNLDSLKHLKEDATEISAGMECGVSLNSFNDLREGDIIQAFILEEVPRSLTELRGEGRVRLPRASFGAREAANVATP